jgi:hypothetical protein
MDETATKLEHCFQIAFPALDPAAIPLAGVDRVPEWDSVSRLAMLKRRLR